MPFDYGSGWLDGLLNNKVVLLAIGGAVGTNARYWIGQGCSQLEWIGGFPLATFLVNVSGSFLLGLFGTIFLHRLPPAYSGLYLLLGTGFCGGFTTFSTFEWETLNLVREGDWPMAAVNVAGSVLAGFIAIVLGVAAAELFVPRP